MIGETKVALPVESGELSPSRPLPRVSPKRISAPRAWGFLFVRRILEIFRVVGVVVDDSTGRTLLKKGPICNLSIGSDKMCHAFS